MKKIKTFIIGFGMLAYFQLVQGQLEPITVAPVPKVHWTFDSKDFSNTDNGTDFHARNEKGDVIVDNNIFGRLYNPGGHWKPDRFGYNHKAFSLNHNGYIDFSNTLYTNSPKFFGLSKYNTNPDAVTISIWVKFTKLTEDERLIFGAKESKNDSDVKFGISLKEKTLYLKQYYEPKGTNNVGTAWTYKLIPPAAFDAGFGWYHLIVVFAKTQKYMRVFLGKPNGGATYGPGTSSMLPGKNKVKREFDGRLIWIPGIRDKLKDFNYWFLGNNTVDMHFDDLMIFDKDLSLDEAKALYNNQKPVVIYSAKTTANENSQLIVDNKKEKVVKIFNIFPNPSKELTTISFNVKTAGKTSLFISDILGKTVHSERFEASKGNNEHTVNIKKLRLPSGLYFVDLETPSGIKMNKKLIVK